MSYQPQGYQQQQQQQQHYPPLPPHPPQQSQQHQQQQQQPPQQHPQQHHPQQQQQPSSQSSTDSGSFPGGNYNIAHRDTNAILNVNLQPGGTVRSKSGAMIHMSGTIQLQGNIKFSMKKLFTGGRMSESTYTGPGRLALGPTLMGDIITLHVDGRTPWTVGKDTFLACTPEVVMETKSQGISKSMFSGEDLFVYRVSGQGLLWLTSFGAVDRLDLQPGEQHIVDNGHLVAWSCDYRIEKAGGGAMSSLKTGEGLVCRFTGPGAVYVQTRNMDEFDSYISSRSSS